MDLASDRLSGFSIGNIPWSSVYRWCRHIGISDPDDVDDYATVISMADGMLQKAADKKNKNKDLGGTNSGGSRPQPNAKSSKAKS